MYITTQIPEPVVLYRGLSWSDMMKTRVTALSDAKVGNIGIVESVDLPEEVEISFTDTNNKRYFNGMVSRVTQHERDEVFTYYALEVVPELWLLDRKLCSRTFQHITVPDILKQLFTGLDVDYQIQGTFEQREYCVQYRETDLAFASRLMEEEGIYYFFKHSSSGHQMVLADTPQSHPAVPYLPSVTFEESARAAMEEDRVLDWSKGQEIRSGKFTARSEEHTSELQSLR